MPTLPIFENLAAQRTRLEKVPFPDGQRAADIAFIWDKWVDEQEKERVGKCEMLDEIEEWILLAQHYCIAWGWRDEGSDIFTEAWKSLAHQETG